MELVELIFDDEGLDDFFEIRTRERFLFRTLDRFVFGRGPSNPLDLSSFNPRTGESAFFDIQDTEIVEEDQP